MIRFKDLTQFLNCLGCSGSDIYFLNPFFRNFIFYNISQLDQDPVAKIKNYCKMKHSSCAEFSYEQFRMAINK